MIGGSTNLIALEIDPELDHERWLRSRMSGLGGSDVPAVVGEDPSRSPAAIFAEKTTGISLFRDTERTAAGREFEPVVLNWFANGGRQWPREGGPYVLVKPPTVYRSDAPWMRASADAFGFYPEAVIDVLPNGTARWLRESSPLLQRKPNFLVEVKTHGWFGSRGYVLTDEDRPLVSVPPDKRIQCAWYMGLYQVDVTYLVCLVDTHLRRTFALRRDPDLESMLMTEADRFWRKHVLTGEPPPPDGTESYTDYLKQRFKKHSAELVDTTPEVDLAAQALIAIKRDEKKLKKDRELAEQVIKARIGEAAGVKTSHGVLTWKWQRSGKMRDKELRAELYQRCGFTDLEIEALEEKYEQPGHRVLRTP